MPMAQKNSYELHRDAMQTAACWTRNDDACLPHFHAGLELVYVFSGSLHTLVDSRAHALQAGELLIVPSYAVHAYESREHNRVMVVIIPPAFVPSVQKTLQEMTFASFVYRAGLDDTLQAILPLMAARWDAFPRTVRKGFCYTLLGTLMDRVGLAPLQSAQKQDVMKDVLTYLEENYQKPLSVEGLARHFGFSRSRFSHLFNARMGCSPGEYLRALRCRQAAQMLLESEKTLSQIAKDAGFDCARTFYRAFKACFQVTPTQYIQQNRAHGAGKEAIS